MIENKIPLSVIILARNEEENITDCIKCAAFASEIIVIDDYSTDKTAGLAQKEGAKIYQHALDGDWSQQKNYALTKATEEWICFLDADERILPELAEEIKGYVQKNEKCAYLLERKVQFKNNRANHGSMRKNYALRLLPKEGIRVEHKVHEAIVHPYVEKRSKHYMDHYTYRSWDDFFNKMNFYSTISAKEHYEKGKKVDFFRDIVLRPLFTFLNVYIAKGGFLDGRIGFVLSVGNYFYTIMKYIKLYYLYKDNGVL